jgi:hypothetical protein
VEPYSVYIHFELLDMIPRRDDQRAKIIKFIRSLATNPYALGDFTDKDANFRTRQVKIIGKYAVTYWIDDPVKAVMVVGIQVADR